MPEKPLMWDTATGILLAIGGSIVATIVGVASWLFRSKYERNEKQLENMSTEMDSKFKEHSIRLRGMEEKYDSLGQKVEDMPSIIAATLQCKFDRMEEKMEARQEKFMERMLDMMNIRLGNGLMKRRGDVLPTYEEDKP